MGFDHENYQLAVAQYGGLQGAKVSMINREAAALEVAGRGAAIYHVSSWVQMGYQR